MSGEKKMRNKRIVLIEADTLLEEVVLETCLLL